MLMIPALLSYERCWPSGKD